MKGYWGPANTSCRCCHSGPKEKFWCQACDHVCKAPVGDSPHCPHCRKPMINMGHRWRPGKKGKRTLWPSKVTERQSWSRVTSRERKAMELLKRWGG